MILEARKDKKNRTKSGSRDPARAKPRRKIKDFAETLELRIIYLFYIWFLILFLLYFPEFSAPERWLATR